MPGAKSLEAELAKWCTSYVAAFSRYDAAGIGAHWAFPALIIHDGNRISFNSAKQFSGNTEFLLDFYKRQGVSRADRKVLSCMAMNADTACMTVQDQMLDAAEQEIVGWQAAYVLQHVDNNWRAVCAVADGEAAAWRARGTPLGT